VFQGGLMKNVGNNLCVDANAPTDPSQLQPCNQKSVSQQWALQSSGHIENVQSNRCLDVYNFVGPDVQVYPCKSPGGNDANQVWKFTNGMLSPQSSSSMCLSGSAKPGTYLSTIDEQGNERCIQNLFGSEGGLVGVICNSSNPSTFFVNFSGTVPPNRIENYTISGTKGAPRWNMQVGASGPWPHTRYMSSSSSSMYEMNLDAAINGRGTSLVASDHVNIIDDNLLGKITKGGNFCLDLVTGGMLEVWAAPLSNGRMSVALFNRSPAEDKISLNWSDIGISGTYQVYDIWESTNKGTFKDMYSAVVASHATAFLILTPAN